VGAVVQVGGELYFRLEDADHRLEATVRGQKEAEEQEHQTYGESGCQAHHRVAPEPPPGRAGHVRHPSHAAYRPSRSSRTTAPRSRCTTRPRSALTISALWGPMTGAA